MEGLGLLARSVVCEGLVCLDFRGCGIGGLEWLRRGRGFPVLSSLNLGMEWWGYM